MKRRHKAKIAYNTYAETLVELTQGSEDEYEKVWEWNQLMKEDQQSWEAVVEVIERFTKDGL